MAMDDPTRLRTVFDPGLNAPVDRHRVQLDLGGGRTTLADLYRPPDAADAALPVVLFIPGDAPQFLMDGLLEWGQYHAWGEAVAGRGLAAVVAQHASTHGLRAAVEVAAEIRDTLAAVRAEAEDLGIDPNRLAVWTASGGASLGAVAALEAVPPVVALVVYYGLLDLRDAAQRVGALDAASAARVSAAAVARGLTTVPPTLLVTAGLDAPALNATAEQFAEAIAGKGDLQRLHHPAGRHAFDILDDDATSADIIAKTLDYLADHLAQQEA